MARAIMLLTGSALALVLGVGPAGALSEKTEVSPSPEQVCQAHKLEASTRYYRCVTYALRKAIVQGGEPSDEQIARCDHRFDRAFERAEANGACRTPGGASPVRETIKAQVQSTFTRVAATQACASLNIAAGNATCGLSTSLSVIDLKDMLEEISSNPAVTSSVDEDTTIWIQAWGGHGGDGASIGVAGDNGHGANYGYAQTPTTVSAISETFGTTELYYYLGRHGTHASESGGDGGTATFVTVEDATARFDLSKTLLAAAGGGGAGNGSGEKGCSFETGLTGGGGAVPISDVGEDKKVSGDDGQGLPKHDYSGQGGGSGGNGGGEGTGGSAQAGANEFAPIGGSGGNNSNPSVGFFNQAGVVVTAGGGRGGSPGDGPSPGGGGGGGLAAGGGGVEGTDLNSDCNAGGGGGGSSLAIASTETCSIAPTAMPNNPNGSPGFVQIGIDLGGCK